MVSSFDYSCQEKLITVVKRNMFIVKSGVPYAALDVLHYSHYSLSSRLNGSSEVSVIDLSRMHILFFYLS